MVLVVCWSGRWWWWWMLTVVPCHAGGRAACRARGRLLSSMLLAEPVLVFVLVRCMLEDMSRCLGIISAEGRDCSVARAML
jgi:hypothetical protein